MAIPTHDVKNSSTAHPGWQGRWILVYLALAAGCVALSLWAAWRLGGVGFPLDDAWIHQTYARNFAATGRLEYFAGQTSAGSTAPLWTLLLAVGYWLGIPFKLWTWALGALGLALCAALAHRLARLLWPQSAWVGPAVGLAVVAEWHLIWAAGSGMEILLFAALALALMGEVMDRSWQDVGRPRWRWVGAGVLAGLLVLVRPEGAVLVALIALWLLAETIVKRSSLKKLILDGCAAAIPGLLLLVPYLWFNLQYSGHLWPNTFYAKQTEYAALLAEPFLSRVGGVLLPILAGSGALLLPGSLVATWLLRKKGRSLLPLVWVLLQVLLYAWRLPVSYQHGRYLQPVIPVLAVYGMGGAMAWLQSTRPFSRGRRVLGRAWVASIFVLSLVFAGIGIQAYARDVQIIESDMVRVARWLSQNSEPDEWVAAHDIGALGYFAGRPVIDLAGLLSPEIVDLMDDPAALSDYVLASPASYLVTAPGWPYRELTGRQDVRLLFASQSEWVAAAGLEGSAVYSLP